MTGLSLTLVWYNLGVAALNTTIAGILILFFFNYSNPVINYFSKISYSLYLTHVFIGGKVINLGLRFVNTNLQRYTLFFIALAVSVVSAHLFYLVIEKPSLKFSKRYRYRTVYS
jgi:peptidoglycan/LPS O-acetylase OafA/YrhL